MLKGGRGGGGNGGLITGVKNVFENKVHYSHVSFKTR